MRGGMQPGPIEVTRAFEIRGFQCADPRVLFPFLRVDLQCALVGRPPTSAFTPERDFAASS